MSASIVVTRCSRHAIHDVSMLEKTEDIEYDRQIGAMSNIITCKHADVRKNGGSAHN